MFSTADGLELSFDDVVNLFVACCMDNDNGVARKWIMDTLGIDQYEVNSIIYTAYSRIGQNPGIMEVPGTTH